MNNLNDYLPRFDLREPAFRHYEPFIAAACRESYTLKPHQIVNRAGRRIKPDTFVCRFRDAVLAYRRYGYTSSVLDRNFDFDRIRLRIRTDGSIDLELQATELALSPAELEERAERIRKLIASGAKVEIG